MSDFKYKHEEFTHNLDSPKHIVPILTNIFKPASVIDVGCGIGTFLYCFKEQGIKEVLGIDGKWADKKLLSKFLQPSEFLEQDLSEDINVERQFDLAMCIEVGEHLSKEDAEKLVKNLTRLSKVIIFSAAIPDQGGQNHINEQWTEYWQQIFKKYDYRFLDVLRPLLWDEEAIQWWYRQNMFVVLHNSLGIEDFNFPAVEKGKIFNYVHPCLLKVKQTEIDKIKTGKLPVTSYLKMLYKRILNK
jgi:SAM-dependent methyltransferase